MLSKRSGSEYKNVDAALFFRDPNHGANGKDFLVFMKNSSTQLSFIDLDQASKPIIKAAVQDVAKKADPNAEWIVYGMSDDYVYGTPDKVLLYRLQNGATYGTTDNSWGSTYNYQVGAVKPYVAAITVYANPAIIAADGSSQSSITAQVTDQYGSGVNGPPNNITIVFTKDATDGTLNPASPATASVDGTGKALATFTSSTTDKVITITATVNKTIF